MSNSTMKSILRKVGYEPSRVETGDIEVVRSSEGVTYRTKGANLIEDNTGLIFGKTKRHIEEGSGGHKP